jgi:hypothetical protein
VKRRVAIRTGGYTEYVSWTQLACAQPARVLVFGRGETRACTAAIMAVRRNSASQYRPIMSQFCALCRLPERLSAADENDFSVPVPRSNPLRPRQRKHGVRTIRLTRVVELADRHLRSSVQSRKGAAPASGVPRERTVMPDLESSGESVDRRSAPPVPGSHSRRSVLRGAAGAGAAAIAASALASAAVPLPAVAATRERHTAVPDAGLPADAGQAEPVVVHVRDIASGEIDVFRGTTQTRLHDRELAARLARASR